MNRNWSGSQSHLHSPEQVNLRSRRDKDDTENAAATSRLIRSAKWIDVIDDVDLPADKPWNARWGILHDESHRWALKSHDKRLRVSDKHLFRNSVSGTEAEFSGSIFSSFSSIIDRSVTHFCWHTDLLQHFFTVTTFLFLLWLAVLMWRQKLDVQRDAGRRLEDNKP